MLFYSLILKKKNFWNKLWKFYCLLNFGGNQNFQPPLGKQTALFNVKYGQEEEGKQESFYDIVSSTCPFFSLPHYPQTS